MMDPNIEHVMTFVRVVETGSFTAAADALKLSKSVVSKHVTALEKSLGNQLIKRTTRKLLVTESGQAFYQHVKDIPATITTAQEILQPFNDYPRGTLKVFAPANFNVSLRTTPIIPDFLTANPEVTLQLEFVRPVTDYLGEKFDIMILWKISDALFPDYNLIGKKLFKMPVDVYASKAYLKKHGEPKTPQDLERHNCFSSIGDRWPFREKGGSSYHLAVSGNLETKTDDIIHSATVSGLGIAYAYPFLFQKELAKKQVVPILQQYTELYIDMYAFYHPTAYVPLKIRAFIDMLQGHYQAMQDEILKRGKI